MKEFSNLIDAHTGKPIQLEGPVWMKEDVNPISKTISEVNHGNDPASDI